MKIVFKNEETKQQFMIYVDKFQLDNDIDATDLISIFQAYESYFEYKQKIDERLQKAITYTSVALSTLQGK